MALRLMELIVLGIVAGLTLLSYSAWKRVRDERSGRQLAAQRARHQRRLAGAEPELSALWPGDVVSHVGVDYIVEGVVTLDDDGRVTRLYRIADGGRVRWLAARPGGEEPWLLDAVSGLADGWQGVPQSAPEELVHVGAPYRLNARSLVRVGRSGALGGLPGSDRAWLSEYAGAGARRILTVAWAERTDSFAGEAVAHALFEILPGS